LEQGGGIFESNQKIGIVGVQALLELAGVIGGDA
jgi:hypothetical protein